MKRVYVRWEVTEEHRGEIQVPDDWSYGTGEDFLMDMLVLSEDGTGDTFFGVVDRVVVEVSDAS